MKWLVSLFALVFSYSAAAHSGEHKQCNNAENSKKLVFVLAGQSNMVGQGMIKNAPEGYLPLPSNVTFHDFTQNFDKEAYQTWKKTGEKKAGYNFLRPRPFRQFGPEAGFAKTLAAKYPCKEIVLIKWAMGATGQVDWRPKWNIAEYGKNARNKHFGSLYALAIKAIKEVELGDNYTLAGFLWFQGENDSAREKWAKSYQANMSTLLAAFRKDLQAPDMPLLMGVINPVSKRHKYVPIVQEQMHKMAKKGHRISLVSAEGLSKKKDNVHYDAQGLVDLGERFAAKWLADWSSQYVN